MTSNNQSEQSRIAEYQAAQDCYIHYDSFTWQVGAVLIAGTFVFWGFLVNSNTHNQIVLSFTCLLVNWLMSIWVLYAEHNREIYLLKLERMRELERSLKMEQHRRFEPDKHITIVYYNKPTLLSGHQLDYLIYTLTSLGGPLIICLR